jgi:hypothetical protein
MSTTTATKTETPAGLDARVATRVLEEGYGAGAWHGPDLRAALDDVAEEAAFRRPAPGRHNIAEIALHHAFCVRAVREKVTGRPAEPFALAGEDWFALDAGGPLSWTQARAALEAEQARLAQALADVAAGRATSPLPDHERFDLALGVTCHAVYHAGQVQLLKRLQQG